MLMQKSISDERTKLLGDFYKAWKKQDEKKQDAFFEKLGINPKIDTMQNIFKIGRAHV